MQADQADFEQFQRKVIRDRSQGLMFGELYRDKELDAKERRQRGISDSYTVRLRLFLDCSTSGMC